MRFSFIHAADLHIDSPLAALGRKDRDVAALFAQASRRAVQNLVEETLSADAAFLIIAGDVFDGDWPDVSTGLFFVRELARLERAGIRVLMVRGNHDAASKMRKSLRWPDNVHEFSSRKAESVELDEHRAVLHGKSFPERNVPDDFVDSYPARREGWLNIGVLHTALDGVRGHASYAPCTEDKLAGFGYDYWALGHIHAAEIVSRNPWIVFPGNVQGRSIRETGAKGAMRVDVEDGRIANVTPIVLDAARWAHVTLDMGGASDDEALFDLAMAHLRDVHAAADGRAVAVRITLSGDTPLHAQLVARHENYSDELRALALRVSDDCWVEKLVLATRKPAEIPSGQLETKSLDLAPLLARAAASNEFAEEIDALCKQVAGKLPKDALDHMDDALPEDEAARAAFAQTVQDFLNGTMADGRSNED